jgi:hypothetical protein
MLSLCFSLSLVFEILSANNSGFFPESCTPSSFPPSPAARTALLADFTQFTEEVLYRARDELRSSHTSSMSKLAIFNPHEAHEEIILTCGNNCASKRGAGLYRSIRGALPLLEGTPVIFEFEVQPVSSGVSTHTLGTSICIGISSRSLNLNTHVGSAFSSIGLCSSGHIISDGQWEEFASDWSVGDTIGVVCVINDVEVDSRSSPRFFSEGESSDDGDASCSSPALSCNLLASPSSDIDVGEMKNDDCSSTPSSVGHLRMANIYFYKNGKPLGARGSSNLPRCFPLDVTFCDHMYPTLSLCTNSVKVMCHFSYADIVYKELPASVFPSLVSLDGIEFKNNL